jgi:hypothetical protein
MKYVVSLTRAKYQYKISIPSKLVDALAWKKEKVLVLEQLKGPFLIIKPLKEVKHVKNRDQGNKY